MIEGADPVLQAFLGTLMTWGLTAAGAAMAFFIKGNQVSWTNKCVGNILIEAATYLATATENICMKI